MDEEDCAGEGVVEGVVPGAAGAEGVYLGFEAEERDEVAKGVGL